jgi:hypothetical protein
MPMPSKKRILILLLIVFLPSLGIAQQTNRNEAGSFISGRITFDGIPPEKKYIDVSQDPICEKINPRLTVEDWVIRKGALANTFVYIKDGTLADGRKLSDVRFAPTQTSAVLNQQGCHYVPHVVGVQVGQILRILNSDPTEYDIHSLPRKNVEWRQSHGRRAPPLEKTFSQSEVMIPVKDHRHPWMKAYIGVLNHPYFAVSGSDGTFEIRGVPPGSYTVAAWHEGGSFGVEKTMQLVVAANRNTTVNFSFASSDIPTGQPLFPQTLPDLEFKKGVWQLVNLGEDGLLYGNSATINTTPQQTVTSWFKEIPNDSPQGQASRQISLDLLEAMGVSRSGAFNYSLTHLEFNCRRRKMRDLLETRYYDEQTLLLYSHSASNYDEDDRAKFSQWEVVIKGSVGEQQLNFVCRKQH